MVTVNLLPTVNAGADQSICIGDGITLSGSGAQSYTWNNGVTNGVSFVPGSTQTYTVTGTDANGCTNTDQVTVIIVPIPTASVSSDVTIGSPTLVVNFDNNSTNATTYNWDFGDGHTQVRNDLLDVTNIYTSVGTYKATATVTDSYGHTGSDTTTISVSNYPPLTIAASSNTKYGGAPLYVTFTATGSGGLPPYKYKFDFGNGITKETVTASSFYTYLTLGTWNAKAYLGDSLSPAGVYNVQSAPITITATGGGPGGIGVQIAADTMVGSAPMLVNFTATPFLGTPPYTWDWTFGDGNTSTTQNASSIYAVNGIYSAYVTATDSLSLVLDSNILELTVQDPITPPPEVGGATFKFHGTDDKTPTDELQYSHYLSPLEVNFGGWYPPVIPSPDPAAARIVTYSTLTAGTEYTFHVKTRDSSLLESSPASETFIWGGTGFSATIRYDNYYSEVLPFDVHFWVELSPGGVAPYTYSWNFGDGSPVDTTETPTHTYASVGTFTVTLLVTDSNLLQAQAKDAIMYMGTVPVNISGTVIDDGWRYFTTFKTNSSQGDKTWSYKTNAAFPDGSGAECSLNAGKKSYYLDTKRLPINPIPTGGTLVGIEVSVLKMGVGIVDQFVGLIKADVGGILTLSDNLADTVTDWGGAFGWVTYGDPTNLWGKSWNPETFTTGQFGVAIRANNTSGSTAVAKVDCVRIRFYWTGVAMPTYPVPIPSVDVTANHEFNAPITGTTDSNGNYIIQPLMPNSTYLVEPFMDSPSGTTGYIFIPEYLSETTVVSPITGADFEATPTAFIYLKKNSSSKPGRLLSASDSTWDYWFMVAHKPITATINLKNIAGGTSPDLDLYVMKNGIPDETEYDYMSATTGPSDEKLQNLDLTAGTYYIGIRNMNKTPNEYTSYTLGVTTS